VDPSISFDQVGGLDSYIKALKEMVFLPLVYPELFERFHIQPPRGVLFYGPPGTGKTLVARALAASASQAGRKARSSKTDQLHNSIVSTLLALMDGLDHRGQIVIIGATNRIDSLDPALRRPGRFDRELAFPLPNQTARSTILSIHTRLWSDQLSQDVLEELAAKTVGYCGADLKGLCTEASMRALRRAYPQIYDSNDKLLVDASSVHVERRDFMAAFAAITPASHRSAATHARPLPKLVEPLLKQNLASILQHLEGSFPPAAACQVQSQGEGRTDTLQAGRQHGCQLMLLDSDEEDVAGQERSMLALAEQQQQPRVLLCGPVGAGQAYLGPALLHALEGLPVHALGLPSLLADANSRSPEEALVHAFMEACRGAPSILYLPHLQAWWETAHAALRATLWMLLAGLAPDLPLLLLTTADVGLQDMDPEALQLFQNSTGAVAQELEPPDAKERRAFFAEICAALAAKPVPRQKRAAKPPPPQLPRAPEAVAAEAAAAAQAEHRKAVAAAAAEETAVRQLRMILRDIASAMLCTRRWQAFAEPVHPDDDPEYWQRVTNPMDVATLLARVDHPGYPTAASFLEDVALIPKGMEQRWRDDPDGLRPCSKARALQDELHSRLEARLSSELRAATDAIAARGGPLKAPVPLAPGDSPGQDHDIDEPVPFPVQHQPESAPSQNPQLPVASENPVMLPASSSPGPIGTQQLQEKLLVQLTGHHPKQAPGELSAAPSFDGMDMCNGEVAAHIDANKLAVGDVSLPASPGLDAEAGQSQTLLSAQSPNAPRHQGWREAATSGNMSERPLSKSLETLALETELLDAVVSYTDGRLVCDLEAVHASLIKKLRQHLHQLDRRRVVDDALSLLQAAA
ncbi:hypothetical protein WJX84_000192, partial [Apatococcus fuscideae]